MRFSLLVVLILVCIFLAGCSSFGARETDEVAWVISMGIDRADDGELLVTYRIAISRALTADGGGEAEKTSALITIKAASLAEARNLLNTSLARAVSLSHVSAIVLGEDLARTGVQDVIGPLMRFREFRGTMFIIVVRGKAQDVFTANKPVLESLVSRWVHNYMHHYDEVSYFLPFNIHEFYTRLKTSSGAPLAVGYSFNVDPGAGKRTANVPDKKVKAYLPGELPKIGGNPAAFAGTAVFKADKLVGFLDTTETRALSILLNKFPKGFFTVEDPLAPKHSVTGAIRNGRKPKIDIDISGEAPVINIDVLLEGEITGNPSGINYETEEYLTLLEAQVSQTIQAHIVNMLQRTQEWGTDVADFGYYIRPKFMTMAEMSNYQWDAKFPYAKINVAVKTELRRTGLMRKTQQIRKDQNM